MQEWNLILLGQLVACVGVTVLTLMLMWRRGACSVGLPLAYLLSLGMIHWAGAFIHALPWHATDASYYTEIGFQECFWGTLGFGLGSLVLAPLVLGLGKWQAERASVEAAPYRLPEIYMGFGVLSFTVLMPLFHFVPSLGAVTVCGVYLVVVGLCLACWRAAGGGSRLVLWGWMGAAAGIPLVTIITMGFVGYGAAAALIVFAFVISFYRPRWHAVVLLGAGVLVGLSFFVTYMRDRTELRARVWGEEDYRERWEQLWTTLSAFEVIDVRNPAHLRAIDERLNQNFLVGVAKDYLNSGGKAFARGRTLYQALIALVPRAIWRNKPVRAGSMGLVSEYTGLEFAQGTSVGLGHVLEFYINFGRVGVFLGLLGLGLVLRVADFVSAWHLGRGDGAAFALWFLPAMSLLNVGGSLVEMTSTAAASWVLVWGVNRVLAWWPTRVQESEAWA